ncbi:hypothetical protein QN277_002507 [Acacia crassicarpa]|uniref:Tubby-like F-box protein n=1 Tax=Acacia crassicarpa TaxID=499986 RepID=A0AAE1THZ4_9FABA|nr:hypothetical protein QN277_002507 [Acacia crassicarpa]
MSLIRVFRSRKFSRSFRGTGALDEDDRRNGIGGGDGAEAGEDPAYGNGWSTMLPELLGEIIRRMEVSEERWPNRQNVVACAGVCKRWREMTREIVRSPSQSSKITFPSCLKEPGPRDSPYQCLIKRNKRTSTFYLYLALTPSFTDKGKFLLAARRYRRGANTEYIISLDAEDFSQGSNAYVGKLSSDFLGTNFTIYDSKPPHNGAKPSSCRASRRFTSKQICPQVPAGESSDNKNLDAADKTNDKEHVVASGYSMLKNKAPRWHEHLQCWCLNFHGRVTVASVKNFQLVATVDQSQPGGKGDEETVLLQFGKVADDTFTMDYRQPLSAFQAFAICLTSFGTKLACE